VLESGIEFHRRQGASEWLLEDVRGTSGQSGRRLLVARTRRLSRAMGAGAQAERREDRGYARLRESRPRVACRRCVIARRRTKEPRLLATRPSCGASICFWTRGAAPQVVPRTAAARRVILAGMIKTGRVVGVILLGLVVALILPALEVNSTLSVFIAFALMLVVVSVLAARAEGQRSRRAIARDEARTTSGEGRE
jgi:hypothetical protein